MPEKSALDAGGTTVTVDFVRHRNVLLVQGDLGPLFTDYYLHLADCHLHPTPEQDRIFKGLLAAFALHCAARPHGEHIAWTVNFQQPLLNAFLAGDNEDNFLAGRLFTDNVKEAPHNIFYSDVVAKRGATPRRSAITFEGAAPIPAVENFYRTSEQRTARYFDLGEDNLAMLIAHPDCDERWLAAVDRPTLRTLAEKETLTRIERRSYQWRCGCSHEKIVTTIAPAARQDIGAVFGDDESVRVSCPRCAAQYVVTREAMEACLAQTLKR